MFCFSLFLLFLILSLKNNWYEISNTIFHLCIPQELCVIDLFYILACNIYSYIYIPQISLQLSTSCYQISFDYASLSLCQNSGNPYVFHILNMCDYFNRCFEQSNNYKYWVTRLVSFFRILIANGVSVTSTTRCTSYFRSGSQLR